MNSLSNVATLLNNVTLTLKDITDLLKVRHDKSMLKVTEMVKDTSFGTVSKMDIVYNIQGQTTETYILNKRQSIAVASRLNVALLMKVIDRLEELEQGVIPTDYPSALRAYADEVEKNMLNAPKVAFADQVAEHNASIQIGEYAKMLSNDTGVKIGPNKLRAFLRDEGYLMKGRGFEVYTGVQGEQNRPYQRWIDAGYFEECPNRDKRGHEMLVTYIRGPGQLALADKIIRNFR